MVDETVAFIQKKRNITPPTTELVCAASFRITSSTDKSPRLRT
jgi:hypothetical protein